MTFPLPDHEQQFQLREEVIIMRYEKPEVILVGSGLDLIQATPKSDIENVDNFQVETLSAYQDEE